MTRLIILLSLFPSLAWAASNSIEEYVPPPMFDESVISIEEAAPEIDTKFPPLPPKRPDKIHVPQSYIKYLREHGRPPEVVRYKKKPSRKSNAGASDVYEDNLVSPSAQDILDQINPQ